MRPPSSPRRLSARSAFARLAFGAALTSRIAHADDPPEEVRVHGRRVADEPSRDTMSTREGKELPGAFGEPLRAIESLPGVTPIASGVPYFFIRGAPPGNTGYFLDGIRVPALFHLGVGPTVFYTALLDRVDVYKGAAPAEIGRAVGGIIEASTTGPVEHRPRVDFTLRVFDAGALVAAPFGAVRGDDPDGEAPGSILLSGRYGYPGTVLAAIPNAQVGFSYWDYQGRASYALTPRDRLTVLAFGSYDSLSTRDPDDAPPGTTPPLEQVLGIEFHRVDVRWDRRVGKAGSITAGITAGTDDTTSQSFAAHATLVSGRLRGETPLTDAVRLRAGADVLAETYHVLIPGGDALEPTSDSGDTQHDLDAAVWADAPIQLTRAIEVTPGIRSDLFTSRVGSSHRAVPSADPRLAARVELGPVAYLAGVGIVHQPSALPLPVPALTFSELRYGLEAAYQMSQGFELRLPAGFTTSATGYIHRYTGLVDLSAHCPNGGVGCTDSLGNGRSIGLELLLKRDLARSITGSVAYTLSRTTRDVWDLETNRRVSVAAEFDRPHVLSATLSFRLGRGWQVGGRFTTYSGIPYATRGSLTLPDARTPAFNRLDLRLEKRWIIGDGRSLAFTVEAFNALMAKEQVGIKCTTPTSCHPQAIGPITVPSIGFEGSL